MLRFQVDADGYAKVYQLSDVTGLQEWVDYVPVQVVGSPVAADAGRCEAAGYIEVNSLADNSGLLAWVDYTPVYVVTGRAAPWVTDDDTGYLPVVTRTGTFV